MTDAALRRSPPFSRSTAFAPLRGMVRVLLMVVGALVIVAGFLIAPLPGPFGLPIAVLGLMLVLKNSAWAKRLFVRMKRRHPRFLHPVRTLMRRPIAIVPIAWLQALRIERLVTGRGARALRRGRRAVMRKRPCATAV